MGLQRVESEESAIRPGRLKALGPLPRQMAARPDVAERKRPNRLQWLQRIISNGREYECQLLQVRKCLEPMETAAANAGVPQVKFPQAHELANLRHTIVCDCGVAQIEFLERRQSGDVPHALIGDPAATQIE